MGIARLLLSIHDLIEHDQLAVERIHKHLGIELSPVPLAEVYDGALLTARAPSARARLAARWYDVDSVGSALRRESDPRG